MSLFVAIRKMLGSDRNGGVPVPVGEGSRTESDLRRDAESILRAAIERVEPERLVADALNGPALEIPDARRVQVAGFGTAAAAMAAGACSVLGDRIVGGVLVVPAGAEPSAPSRLECFEGGHPVPDQGGVAGSRAIRQLAREASADDLLLCLVSAGGSSLLTVPPDGLPLEDVQTVTRLLLRSGASGTEINCVRKHLDLLKGGRLALEAAPAKVLALVLSNVVGDPLDVIASGPLCPDGSQAADAVDVLRRHRIWKNLPLAVRGYLDRGLCGEIEAPPPPEHPCFERVRCSLAGNGHLAARAGCQRAEQLGYESQLLTTTLRGDARRAGRFLAATAQALAPTRGPGRPPLCVMAAGATRGSGKVDTAAHPNQEVALAAAAEIDTLGPMLIASMATAGLDRPSEAAGAIATSSTLRRARESGFDLAGTGAGCEAHSVFEALGDLIVSGPTGTDVGDLQLLLLP
jgi:hydroxypyruvate reductase